MQLTKPWRAISISRFLATFPAGFEFILAPALPSIFPEAADIRPLGGAVLFSLPHLPGHISDIPCFTNVFLLLREWNSSSCPFPEMIKQTKRKSLIANAQPVIAAHGSRTFRVRYSRENVFCSVDKALMKDTEVFIESETGLASDRVNPDLEFWFGVRSEQFSFFALRLPPPQEAVQAPRRGELKRELASLLVFASGINGAERSILDPFAGWGAIPQAVSAHFADAKALENSSSGITITAVDRSPECVSFLESRFADNPQVCVRESNALALDWLADESVDAVITDPPWGDWVGDGNEALSDLKLFYASMLRELFRVLVPKGILCVLCGAKAEFEAAVAVSGFTPASPFKTDILVNGKKSALYKLIK